MDGRLFISFIAVCFSGFAIVWDFYHPFPESKIVCFLFFIKFIKVLGVCSVTYFFLMGIWQLYQWYIEKNCFYQAIESDGKVKRTWKWSSVMKKFVIFGKVYI